MDKRKENDLLELKIKVKEQELREAKRERDKFGGEPLILIIKSFILAIFLSALLLYCRAWILFIAVLLLFVGG